ncbi:MAG: ribonuclease P protein component, partial [Actinomycetes bacterium]
MLTRSNRLTSSEVFAQTVRRGRRAGTTTLVLHLGDSAGPVPQIGFVVSKAVGNSVVRHRVARRLRHLFRDRLGTVAPGCSLVVRALPPAAGAASAELGNDID